jgi:putative nucleotide binding protein
MSGENMNEPKIREDVVIVLDFLPNGYSDDPTPMHRKTAIVQAIGTNKFTLLELVPKKEVFLQPNQEVYIGEGKRDQIHHINGKLAFSRLSNTAQQELEHTVSAIVKKNPQPYIDFFNKSQPLSTRMHVLELLPGLGKKHMWEIVEQRQLQPFTSFEDIRKRVKLMPDPEKIIVKRILQELEGNEKYRLFA